MQSVGTRIREARIKKGYTLEDINARTRISLKNLNAIESDDLSKISSPFTYRSFVKQTAEVIGLDYDSLCPAVQTASSTMPEPLVPGQEEEVFVRPHQFQPVKPKRDRTWVYRMASIAALVGLISCYFLWRNSTTEAAKLPSSVLPASSEVVVPDAPAENDSTRPPVLTPVVAQSRRSTSSASGADASSRSNGTEQLLAPAAVAAGQGEGESEADAGAIHIELSAIEPTWLSIAADGKTTYTGVLDAMQTKVFDGRETARIRTQNAGGVNIIFNGRALGALGQHGQARTFVFTKSGYEVVQGVVRPTGE